MVLSFLVNGVFESKSSSSVSQEQSIEITQDPKVIQKWPSLSQKVVSKSVLEGVPIKHLKMTVPQSDTK